MPQTVMGNLSWASSDGSSVEIYVLSAAGTGYPQTSPAASTGEHTFQFYVGGSAVWTTPPASASAVVAITVSYGVTFLLSGTTVPAVGSFCPP